MVGNGGTSHLLSCLCVPLHWQVKFKVLFDETGDIFEALGGTLRAAKKRKVVTFAAEMLLQGRDDDVDIVLLEQAA